MEFNFSFSNLISPSLYKGNKIVASPKMEFETQYIELCKIKYALKDFMYRDSDASSMCTYFYNNKNSIIIIVIFTIIPIII